MDRTVYVVSSVSGKLATTICRIVLAHSSSWPAEEEGNKVFQDVGTYRSLYQSTRYHLPPLWKHRILRLLFSKAFA